MSPFPAEGDIPPRSTLKPTSLHSGYEVPSGIKDLQLPDSTAVSHPLAGTSPCMPRALIAVNYFDYQPCL